MRPRSYGPLVLFALAAPALVALACAPGCADSAAETVSETALPADDATERTRTAERLAALFDYVASDYGGAVVDGKIVSQFEYDEQISLVEDMRRFAKELGAPAKEKIDALDALIRRLGPAAEVADRCAALRKETVEKFDLAVAPAFPPDLARAEALYRERCLDCHGADGRGQTARAKTLEPPPADLMDPDRMAGVTPYRAYCAITYGIEGTAMAGHSVVSDADRWSLAFHAVAIRHRAALAREGAAPREAAAAPARPQTLAKLGLATLANETDAGLDRLLVRSFPDPEERAREIARLRAEAPFSPSIAESPFALARRLVADARAAARAGRSEEGDRLVLDAYLHGIEAFEPGLAARDPALVHEIEAAVPKLRAAIRARSADVDARATRLLSLIDRAEGAEDRSPFGAAMLAFAGALVILREGIEAALVVAALLAVVRRTAGGRGARAVHAGWTAAIAAGVATFALARWVVHGLFAQREAIEAVTSLLAAAVLVFTSFWLISKADARRWMAYLKEHAGAAATGGSLFGLASVAFLAVYREAFESVLFLEALSGGEATRLAVVLGGAAAGVIPLAAAIYAILKLEKRLPIGAFFGISGAALLGLAVILVGHGTSALQKAGILAPRPFDWPAVPWLGVYPDAVAVMAQVGLAGVLAVVAVGWTIRNRLRG